MKDKIPSRLVKMASNFLPELITDIINTAIYTNTFPDRAKRASVTPIDKGWNDKNIHTNYWLVSVLNTFSKIIELAIFDQMTSPTKRDSNYIADVVMWPKFGNSCISMREFIITSSL